MKRKNLFFLLMAIWASISIEALGQYVLSINGEKIEMAVGVEKTAVLTNGQKVTVLLEKKDIVAFESRYFTFRHKSDLTPVKTKTDNDGSQTQMTSATGTTVIVQEYLSSDPSSVINGLIQNLTQEEVRLGYQKKEKSHQIKLADGKVMKGKIVSTSLKNEQWTRCVLACGNENGGVLCITQAEKSASDADRQMIDLFWKSLSLKGF